MDTDPLCYLHVGEWQTLIRAETESKNMPPDLQESTLERVVHLSGECIRAELQPMYVHSDIQLPFGPVPSLP